MWFTGLIAQWLERRSNKAKIPGSNPGGAYFFTLSTIFAYENNFVAKIRTILINIICGKNKNNFTKYNFVAKIRTKP